MDLADLATRAGYEPQSAFAGLVPQQQGVLGFVIGTGFHAYMTTITTPEHLFGRSYRKAVQRPDRAGFI